MPSQSPRPNLLVLRSPDMDRAVKFYEALGLKFSRHAHGKGPQHYSAASEGFVFEIYPQSVPAESTQATRLGIAVVSVDESAKAVAGLGVEIISQPKDSPWGRRAVVKDLDGHTVELTEI